MVSAEELLSWWQGFPAVFAVTCLVEVPVYLLAFLIVGWFRPHPGGGPALTPGRAAALALAVNVITGPAVWWVALRAETQGQVMVAELVAATVEALIIFAAVARRGPDTRSVRLGWAFMTALGANTLALVVDLLVLPALPGQ